MTRQECENYEKGKSWHKEGFWRVGQMTLEQVKRKYLI